MAKLPRSKCARLPEKLLRIRVALNLSQTGMLRELGLEEQSFRSTISGYELGTKEPALPILLRYARLAGVCAEILIDDELNLPEQIPQMPAHKSLS